MKFLLKHKAEAIPITLIVIFFIAFFWPAIFSGMCFVGADSLVEFYPMRAAAWKIIRGGAAPLWTPHILSGFPMLAMATLGIGYPLTWGYLFLPSHIAEEIYVLAPYLLAPTFVYAYLRTVNCSRLGSLLAGLSFAYGGMMMSGLGQNATFTNAVMWLPLMLIAIERARTGRFLLCLVGAGVAFAMSVLTGLAQMFVYVGLIAVGYGAFLSLARGSAFEAPPTDGSSSPSRLSRFRPLIVGLSAVTTGAGVAAFQIFETMQAHRLSHRRMMTYETFSGGSFGPSAFWKSFINPIYSNHYEVSAYVAPLAVVFALIAVVAATRSSEQRLRVCFWLLVAALGLLLIMGDHTPFYRLLYHIPMINRFRHPWRHTYEWTLGVSMLAAFGWDAAARFFSRATGASDVKPAWRWSAGATGALPLALCVVATVAFMRLAGYPIRAWTAFPPGPSETTMALTKLAHTLLLFIALWWGWRKTPPAVRGAILAMTIMLACFWEQYLWASGWWFPQNKLASDFAQASPQTRFLEGRAPEEGRIYTSLLPWGSPDFRRREPHNLTARHGFHNAAGYEPLMTERYSLIFGGVRDYITPTFDSPTDPQILNPRWQALDLLNVRYVIRSGVSQEWTEKDGARFASDDTPFNLASGSSVALEGDSSPVDSLSMVTMTSNSTHLPQGGVVANLNVHTTDGRRIERQIEAGVDTAEWAHERPDVKSVIRHSLARIFASVPVDGFTAHLYWTKFDLGMKTVVDHVELKCVAEGATLTVFKATAYDSSGGQARLLTQRMVEHWRKVYDDKNVMIYENPHALPRAWLVPRVETVSPEEALRRIRGESEQPFDPREVALFEPLDNVKAALPQAKFDSPAEARVIEYEPNRLTIETSADKRAALVVSETNYPGWEATIDGQPATIFNADYLLRGVIVPDGRHRVEMRYTAPAARRGAIISALTLLALIGAIILGRTKR